MRRLLAFLLIGGAAAQAAPPESPGFQRMDDLRVTLTNRYQELKKREEFEAKALPEKLVLLLERNDPNLKRFERVRLTPEDVAETVFEWEEVDRAAPTVAAQRTLDLLAAVLTKRFAGPSVVEVNKRERKAVSIVLCKELMSKHFHVRVAAIEALKGIYREKDGRLYKPEAPERVRRDRAEAWKKYVIRQNR